MALHHTRKMAASDPFDTISGTTGLTGAVDAGMVLATDDDGVTLYGRGRDIEEVSTALEFDRETGRWMAPGEREEVRRSEPRKAILNLLAAYPDQNMTVPEIADRLGEKVNNVKQLVHKMKHDGEIKPHGRGVYSTLDFREFDDRDNFDDFDNRWHDE